ncbi:MAG: acetate/propionate family kinase [Hyphomicrobiaceae bacterium]
MIAKQLIYLAGAEAAGIVLGARVPIVLTSRADGTLARLASCAVAQAFAALRREPEEWRQSVSDAILVFNAGSSSIKFALYETVSLEPLCRGVLEGIGRAVRLNLDAKAGASSRSRFAKPPETAIHAELTGWLLQEICRVYDTTNIVGAGHRVVHGGQGYADPVLVDADVLSALSALIPLAPNHQPHNLAPINAIANLWPSLPQVACFDTAFHRTQPRIAQLFALPRKYLDGGILRYGFHGLSYDFIAGVLPDYAGPRAGGRVIVAHLGHGASMCALKDGRSVATTMGFTALDGLMMGKRCGALDPGVILHLLQQKGMSTEDVANLLNNQSGLLGVSGCSDDVRDLEASDDPNAEEALSLFAYRAAREIGSLAAAAGGLDVLVFTAGIGEHSAAMRQRICTASGWLGIGLDDAANQRHGPKISHTDSSVDVFVIPTDEEIVIARATWRLAAGLAQ